MAEDADVCAAGNGWALPDGEVLAALAEVHGLEQRLAAVRLGLVRELDARDLGVKQGAAGSAGWLWERLHVTIPTARRWVQLAKTWTARRWPRPAGRWPPVGSRASRCR